MSGIYLRTYIAVCGNNTNELRSRGNTHSQRSADIRRSAAALRTTALLSHHIQRGLPNLW